METENTEAAEVQGEGKAAPWTDETFDAERAWKLVENLRAEVDSYKPFKEKAEQAAAFEAEVAVLKEQLAEQMKAVAEREAEIAEISAARTKEKLLAERGLPANLINALNGESEKDWKDMANLLSSLRGSEGESAKPMPDPVQSSPGAKPTAEAEKAAWAKQIFG